MLDLIVKTWCSSCIDTAKIIAGVKPDNPKGDSNGKDTHNHYHEVHYHQNNYDKDTNRRVKDIQRKLK